MVFLYYDYFNISRLQARRNVPDTLLKEIISLNSLDMELYKYAKEIFQKQHQIMKLQDSVSSVTPVSFTNFIKFEFVSKRSYLGFCFSWINFRRSGIT